MIPEIITGVITVIAALVGALFYTKTKKDAAEQKAAESEENLAAERAMRLKEQQIQKHVAEAREQSAATRQEHEDRPSDVPPSGDFRR